MMGGQATEQGDCSKFREGITPHCCQTRPTIVDLMPEAPYTERIANCCKGGVINSMVQDPGSALTYFQLWVGYAGTSKTTVRMPGEFTFMTPGPGYSCGPLVNDAPTKYTTADGRRFTQAIMTWTVTCTYSQFLAQKAPACCVSLSSFYSSTITPCTTCSCGCQKNNSYPGSCVEPSSPYVESVVTEANKHKYAPLVQCTSHMCPIRVHWHVKVNYREYWRVKITITNFNYRMNYTQWNLVALHPNFDNVAQIFSFNYKPLPQLYNDTAMLWGVKSYNDLLMQAGPFGYVQSEILFKKNKSTFTLDGGWAFPGRIYFNGDNCVMPPADVYPYLPSCSPCSRISLFSLMLTLLLFFALSCRFT